jgi:hypothetical protein
MKRYLPRGISVTVITIPDQFLLNKSGWRGVKMYSLIPGLSAPLIPRSFGMQSYLR